MSLLDTDDDTLRDRMERSPELMVREMRRLQTELDTVLGRAREVQSTRNADLHHGRGAARTAHYIRTGYWADDAS